MSKKEYYQTLLTATEKQFDRGASTSWKNKDFEDLSKAIWQASHIMISAATLKRIFGKVHTAEDYFPQQSTLDALELYAKPNLANQNTADAVNIHLGTPNNETIITPLPTGNFLTHSTSKFKYLWLVLLSGLFAFFVYYFIKTRDVNKTISLSFVKKEGDYPATFYFRTNLSGIKDSVFFDKADNSKSVYIPDTCTYFPIYYSYPGVFYSKLFTKNGIHSNTLSCAVYTNEWYASVYYFNNEAVGPNIQISEVKKDGCLQVSQAYLNSINLDTTKLINLKLQNIRPTGVSGDFLKSKFVFKNPKNKQPSLCRVSSIELLGSKGRIKFSFLYPGCSYFLNAVLSEKKITLTDGDLSGFVTDLSQWKNIEINNLHKKVFVTLDGKSIFHAEYQQSIGEMLGVNVWFNGTGMLKTVNIKTGDDQKVLFNY